MTSARTPLDRLPEATPTSGALAHRVRLIVADRVEETLAELPATLRRLRTLLLVVSVAVPLFLAALVAVLWRLAG